MLGGTMAPLAIHTVPPLVYDTQLPRACVHLQHVCVLIKVGLI